MHVSVPFFQNTAISSNMLRGVTVSGHLFFFFGLVQCTQEICDVCMFLALPVFEQFRHRSCGCCLTYNVLPATNPGNCNAAADTASGHKVETFAIIPSNANPSRGLPQLLIKSFGISLQRYGLISSAPDSLAEPLLRDK